MSIDYTKVLFLQYNEKNNDWRDITSEILAYRRETTACWIQYITSEQWYPKSYRDVKILENPQKVDIDNVVVFCHGTALTNVTHVLRFDNWYKVFFENGRVSSYEASKVSFEENKNKEPEIKQLLDYLIEVARYISVEEGQDFLVNQLDSLFISEESVFSKLINRTISHKEYNDLVIFPFSTNASQQKAVKIAIEDDLSLIQGPPGTGKTQTILNIIANMIVQGKSVAVVSGNNEATKNVFQKIDAAGYGYINAFLGRKDYITAFFEENQSGIPTSTSTECSKDDFASQSNLLKEGYLKKLKQSENAQKISELETEKAINDAEYHLRERVVPKSLLKKNYTSKKLLELSSVLQCVSQEQYIRFFTRVRLLFRFGIIRTKEMLNNPYDIIEYLENQYYIAKIEELVGENEKINAFLKANNFDALLGDFTQYSKVVLETALTNRFRKPFGEFTEKNYRYRFDEFVRRYPKRDAVKNYFPLPNEIFCLDLSAGEIAVYAYLMFCEDRKTFQCHPSYKTIGNAVGLSKNTVKKYIDGLVAKQLITTEPTTVITKKGQKHNGTLLYTIRPIQEAVEYRYQQQLMHFQTEMYRQKALEKLKNFDRTQGSKIKQEKA